MLHIRIIDCLHVYLSSLSLGISSVVCRSDGRSHRGGGFRWLLTGWRTICFRGANVRGGMTHRKAVYIDVKGVYKRAKNTMYIWTVLV